MTAGVVKSQGTHVYFVHTLQSDPTLVKLSCPTGVTGLGGPKDQIEDTCLDATVDKTFQSGLGNPGQVTIPFNLVPREASHQILFDLKEAGTVLPWSALLSESATAPTLDSDGLIAVPNDRTSLSFSAYISDVAIDVAGNDIVKGTLTLQRSGVIVPLWYDPA